MYGDMFQSFFYMKGFGIRQKDLPNYIREIRSGWRRIRTFEGIASRFTVCPIWPCVNLSLNLFHYIQYRYILQFIFSFFTPFAA